MGITFQALGVYSEMYFGGAPSGNFQVTVLTQYELVVRETFTTFPQPACKGNLILEHMESGTTKFWAYYIDSNSFYVETCSDDWLVTLSPGEWNFTHIQTSGSGDLTIRATVTGHSYLDEAIINWLLIAMAIVGLISLCTAMKNLSD